MSVKPLITSELLFAYFAGRATALQKQMIEEWVEEDGDNEEFFYACMHEWEVKHLQYSADTNAAVARFYDSIQNQNHFDLQPELEQRNSLETKKSRGWQKWLIAASVLFVLQFGAWLMRDAILYKSYTTSNGEVNSVILMDGSQVALNENSSLRVPRFGFGELSRNVRLRGEARFSVVHTPDDKKFIVFTDSAFQVEVLGTEFNLSARESGAKVVLQEGKVKVLYQGTPEQDSTPLIMAPGDIVALNKNHKELQVKKVLHPQNYSAWQHGRLVFDNTSLHEIKDLLQDNYGLTVEVKGEDLLKKTVSGSFRANNVNELLYAFSEIMNINVVRQDSLVIFVN
ncbi:DUF4974 domain-containing protein [Pontibacter diazotrophicus]|uniref:DUF4974 domain-containing protein n=1 Tax=Pontibacter diazotrophicus TaxID=1400979 RepID=A0A3D8LDE3_9BACT|nr:FecR domain-containing protein [Pontibacter diazotrophicus]RDV15461.1 DUF4974 domain-containing protein [Pontibacter diazotrophicus]